MEPQRPSVNLSPGRPTKNASLHLRYRRILIGVVIVVVSILASTLAISMAKVSKLTITLSNNSNEHLLVRVWVDEFDDQHAILEPDESISFEWAITGELTHRYFVLHHDPDILVSVILIWTYIRICPFSEETLYLAIV